MSALDAVDGLAAGRALGASGLLATLNAADVLDASDVHVALRAGALTGEADQELLLALAMVVRALRSGRSEEHTSELQSLMRISYAVFCLKKKKQKHYSTLTIGNNH